MSDYPTSWSWDFGDTGTSTEINPTHTYVTPGTYSVELAVTNALGSDTETKVDYIVVNPNTNPPVANFEADVTTVLVGGTVNFTDLSANLPTSWDWSFEGGTPLTSTDQNPSVVYNSPGTYQVELTAYNAFGNDTETKLAYITVSLPSYCAAGSSSTAYEHISNFTCNTINNASGSDGYADYTSISTEMDIGSSHAFSVTNGNGYSTDQCLIWADWNRDGDFDDTDEALFASATGTGPYTGNIDVPVSATEGDVRVRIRIHDTNTSYSPNSTPCGTSGYGEVEDYTILVTDPSAPPVADFEADQTTVPMGSTVNFTDLTSNAPMSWDWTFDGGTPSTSTDQNPSIVYNTIGTYDVTLTATNLVTNDVETKVGYITVTEVPDVIVEWDFADNDNIADYGIPANIGIKTLSSFNITDVLFTGSANADGWANVATSGDNWNTVFTTTGYGTLKFSFDQMSDNADSPRDFKVQYSLDGSAWTDLGINVTLTEDVWHYTTDFNMPVECENQVDVYLRWVMTSNTSCDGTTVTDNSTTRRNYLDNVVVTGLPLNASPVADFSADVTDGCDNLSVNFTDLTTNAPDSWDWTFGDGGTSTDQNPTYNYTSPVTYSVTLEVSNASGSDLITYTDLITVGTTPTVDAPADVAACDSYFLPALTNGDYYETSVGINPLPVGYEVTSDMTIYVYAANGSCSAENTFLVDITTTPLVDAPADVSACDSYFLPALTNGDYYETSGGINPLPVGYEVTSDMTIYVYAADGSCTAENTFLVDITTTPLVDAPADVSACDSYFLPALTNGDYYETSGGINPLPVGYEVTSDMTIYVYAADGSCTAENSFLVDITTTPLVDAPADVSACDSYFLPALTNGDYYETTGGINPLPVGYEVTSDMTIYVYAADGSCTAENTFLVDITTTPLVDAPADVAACDSYFLPALTNGDYYETSGVINPLSVGYEVTSDMTIYVFAADGSCTAENTFLVDITTTPLVDAPADVSACDSYFLPALTNGDYYETSGGINPLPVGYEVTSDMTIYVYAADGACTAENIFNVTINPVVEFTLSSTDESFAGANDGTITVNITSGVPDYSIFWSTGSDVTSSSSYLINGLSNGSYTITVEDINGCNDTDFATVNSSGAAPIASFSADVTDGCDILTVSFTDQSANSPTSWAWDFGDGVGTSTDPNPSYTYTAPGIYTVELTAINGGGSDVVSYVDYITVYETPSVDAPADVSACDSYFLPALTDGDYYETSGGSNPLPVGYEVTSDMTVYVYAANGSCTAENDFFVDITATPLIDAPADVSACDSYTLPALTNGDYYQNTGGVDPLPVGYEVTYDMTVYVYAANGSCTAENDFFVDITTTPLIDAPADVSACDSYTLPALTNGDYYQNTGGVDPLPVGYEVTSDMTVYVYAANGTCTAENSFNVTIHSGFTFVVSATDESFAGANDGTITVDITGGSSDYIIDWGIGSDVTSSTSYVINGLAGGVYTITVTDANTCEAVEAATVNVAGAVPIAAFSADVTEGCDMLTVSFTDESTNSPTSWAWDFGDGGSSSDQNPVYTYTLPGVYTVELTATNGGGSDIATMTDYIVVTGTPTVDAPADVSACNSYILPALTDGEYFETTGGVGPLPVGYEITSDMTIYVYAVNGVCVAENSFTVTIHESPTVTVDVTHASG
ncbi:MAG: hypothetical protein C0596_05045 [Marinilabiliales bacterium]|nr:MAG: hypothetical protein C0596_05045 [Marinilabiliales bacterium]